VFSTTYPTPAISDGGHYRALAYDNKKPCIELKSEWEDILFRIGSLNQYKLDTIFFSFDAFPNFLLAQTRKISGAMKAPLQEAEQLLTPLPSGELDERKVEMAKEILVKVINELINACET